MPFVKAMRLAEISPGQIREVQVEGKAVAVANLEGKIYAMNGACPHLGGPLGEGSLAGRIVTCPWHGWQFDVTSGKDVHNPTGGVACYPAEVRGEDVFVDLG